MGRPTYMKQITSHQIYMHQPYGLAMVRVQLGSGKTEIRIEPNQISRFASVPNIFDSVFELEITNRFKSVSVSV